MSQRIDRGISAGTQEAGFTLIELLIAMAIAGIILGAVSTSYLSQQRTAANQEQVADMQQNLRAGLYMMEREIKLAGFDPSGTNGAGITSASEKSLSFTLLADSDNEDNDGDGIKDNPGELNKITYNLYDSGGDRDLDLGRQAGFRDDDGKVKANVRQAVAHNIDAIEFYYTLQDGSQTSSPSDADLPNIRSIRISLLARTGRLDREFSNTRLYIPASGIANWDINGSAAGTGNPVNDGFRRRLLITTIHCRNMGI